jgi:hypothetical protein
VDLDGDRQADVVWRLVQHDGQPEIERLIHQDHRWTLSARLPIARFDPLAAGSRGLSDTGGRPARLVHSTNRGPSPRAR